MYPSFYLAMEAPNPGVLAVASVRVREERHLARGSRCRRPRSERFRTREIGHRVDVAGCARNGTSGDAVTTFGLSVIGEPVSDTGGENPAGGYTGSSIVVWGSAAHPATAPACWTRSSGGWACASPTANV